MSLAKPAINWSHLAGKRHQRSVATDFRTMQGYCGVNGRTARIDR